MTVGGMGFIPERLLMMMMMIIYWCRSGSGSGWPFIVAVNIFLIFFILKHDSVDFVLDPVSLV